MQRGVTRSPLPWLAGLIAVYLAVPVGAFIIRFASTGNRGFGTAGLFPSLLVSIESATISLVLITVLGVPLAYLLARSTSRTASVLGVIVQLPLALPPLMCGILLVYLVGPYTFLGRLFDGHLTMSLTGVVLAQTFVSAPFLIVAARASFSTVNPSLMDVAATLGHSEFSRFRRVALPVASPGIRAGMLLAWLRAFGEYGAVVVIAYHPFSLPVFTYNQFSGAGLPTTLAPTALALLVAVGVVSLSRIRLNARPGPISVPEPSTPALAIPHPISSFHLEVSHQPQGNRLAVLGPSGSGKSTLLRCLAGLYGAGPGGVRFGSRSVEEVRAEDRRVGYVAQRFSLYPHMTVWQHLMFAREATPSMAAHWLARLRLDGLQDRYPSELSGGQQQRVGLAQALCSSPELLLLDEPFSALDPPVRRDLQRELRRLQRDTGLSTVLVTHDPEEAALLSDEIIVLSDGTSLQSGGSRQVFSHPASPDVARLLGIPNLHRATITGPDLMNTDGVVLEVDTGAIGPNTGVLWSIRPEHIRLRPDEGLTGTLMDIAHLGTATELVIAISSTLRLELRTPDDIDLEVGQLCHIELPRDAITVWPEPATNSAVSSNGDQANR
jgi:ABC-type Fe3+/spermidine/putrescine transport system ATPase subunit/ABC-type sulfate transport system permease component